MSGPIFRVVLGILAAAWTLEAAAQDRAAFNAPPDYASESFSPSADALAYVADPSESYVVEGALADEAEAAPPQQTAQASAPACRAYFPAGAAGDRSGTLCEQTDGSLRIVQAPAFTAAATAPPRASQYCREYQQTVAAGGRPRVAYGKACRLPDGSWQIVTPPTFAETPDFEAHRPGPRSYAADTFAPAYQPPPITARAAAAPIPARSYTPPVRTYDNRLRLPEFYFGNLFWWLPRAKHETGRHKDRDRYDD